MRREWNGSRAGTKSTALYVYIGAVIGVLLASALIEADDDAGRDDQFGDYFTAHDVWRLMPRRTARATGLG